MPVPYSSKSRVVGAQNSEPLRPRQYDMFFTLIILFTILPAMELYVLLKVGGVIGAANTILVIILTGVLGAALARQQGFALLASIQERLGRGELPTEEMMDGLMVLTGGILLLTPGFITDTLGFLLLIPLTRTLMKKIVRTQMTHWQQTGEGVTITSSKKPPRRDVEDADFWEDSR